MPPITRSQSRRYYQSTTAPFPSLSMSQRYGTARVGSARTRQVRTAFTRSNNVHLQSQDVISDDSSDNNDDDGRSSNDDEEDGSDDSDNDQNTEAANQRRTARMVRQLTLVIAPEPVEEYAADASQLLPHRIRRTDEGTEFQRVVEILTRVSIQSDTFRRLVLDQTPVGLHTNRWGDVMLRRFANSLRTIQKNFADWIRGAVHGGADVVDTGNALRNWMAGLAYILPERMEAMALQTRIGFVEHLLNALEFVVRNDLDARGLRTTPDYATQPQTQNNLYYNTIANGRRDAFGMVPLSLLRDAIRTEAHVRTVRDLWTSIRQRHPVVGANGNGLRPSAHFVDLLSSLNVWVSSQR